MWVKVIDTANSPQIKSPLKHNTLSNTMQTYTPGIKGSESPSVSPARYENNQTPTRLNKSQTKKFKDSTQGKSGKKRSIATTGQVVRNMNTLAQLQKSQSLRYDKEIRLNSPVSSQMKRSFLIKSHDVANFDSAYQTMRKRRTDRTQGVRMNDMQSAGGASTNMAGSASPGTSRS